VSSFEWRQIRETAEHQMEFPFPWFHDAGVFFVSQIPAGILFLIGWGPIYRDLPPDLQAEYGLVPGALILAMIISLVLGVFFLFLGHRMNEHSSADAGSVVELMDRAHRPDA
jgi:hypothetical protein